MTPHESGYRVRQMRELAQKVCAGVLLVGGLSACSIPLLNASASGDTERVRDLLRNGHHANDSFPIVGTCPLILASANGHAETVAALLDAGADIHARDLTGWTALHAAAFRGDRATVSLLLERGAVLQKSRWYLPNPAQVAEMSGHPEIIDLLQQTELARDPAVPTLNSPTP